MIDTPSEIRVVAINFDAPPPKTDAAIYPWWSFSKTVLAAAALKLVANGKLALDAELGETSFTLRHLLQHTSGLRDYATLAAYKKAVAAADEPWTPGQMWDEARADDLLFQPGGGWYYSNIGYWFIRRLIERTCDCELASALDELVFAPLDLKTAAHIETKPDIARYHLEGASDFDPAWVFHGLIAGTGDAACRMLGSVLWTDFLPDYLRREMQSIHILPGVPHGRPWAETGYGLGLMTGLNINAATVAGHTGQGPNSAAAIYANIDEDKRCLAAAFAPSPSESAVENASFKALDEISRTQTK